MLYLPLGQFVQAEEEVLPDVGLYLPLPQFVQDAWLVVVDDAVAYLPGPQSPDLQLAWPSWSW